jgi:hypothetical protein
MGPVLLAWAVVNRRGVSGLGEATLAEVHQGKNLDRLVALCAAGHVVTFGAVLLTRLLRPEQ